MATSIDTETHDQIVATFDEWTRAIVANDAIRIAAFMTDDWEIVSEYGVMTRADYLARVESGMLTHSAMDRVGPARTKIVRDVAILTVRVTSTAQYDGQPSDADEWSTDVLVRSGDRWVCAHTQITAARAG